MRNGPLASVLGLTTGACATLFASVALAADAEQLVSALNLADSADVLRGTSIMSQATSGLFEESIDFSFRPEFVGQIQRDEATRGLSRPSSGGDGTPSILYTNLTSLNTVDTFSIGGVKRVGVGNLALRGGYLSQKDRAQSTPNPSRSLDSSRFWQVEALYGFKLGSGYLGMGLEQTRGDVNKLNEDEATFTDYSYSRKNRKLKLGIGYSQPAGNKRGWSVGAWLSDIDVLDDERFNFRLRYSTRDLIDLSGRTIDIRGRYNISFGDADGEVSAGVRRGTFNLDNPVTQAVVDSAPFSYTERVSYDDTKRTTYDIGWRFLDRLGEKVDLACGVQYAYSKIDSEVQSRINLNNELLNYRTAFSNDYSELIIPVAVRFQLNPMFRMFAGAGFTYYWDETTDDFDFQRQDTIRTSKEHSHTATNYAAGLRMDFNEHLSGELGLLHPAEDEAENDRDTVQGDRFSFQFALSF